MKTLFRFIGRLAFIFVLLSSALVKFKQHHYFVTTYQNLYQTFHVTLRQLHSPINVSINTMDQYLAYIVVFVAIYQIIAAILLFIGSKYGGYMLFLYYVCEGIIQFSPKIFGVRGGFLSIPLRFQAMRYIAILGFAFLFSYKGYKLKKPY